MNKKSESPLGDGLDISAYSGYETAPPAAWAWMFLRRNEKFQKRCDALPSKDHPERKQLERQIAWDFYLRHFKHWRENIKLREIEGRSPIFSTITSWQNPSAAGKEKKIHKISLRDDQMLIRFDVRAIARDKKSLSIQLKDAHDRLLFLAQLLQQDELVTNRARGATKDRLRWLRAYDAEKAGYDSAEAYYIIAGVKPDAISRQEAQKAFSELLSKARKLIEDHRYLVLAYEDVPIIAFDKARSSKRK